MLYTMDDQYERKHMWIEPKLDMKPSEYFKRQGHTTFSDDLAALRMLDFIGPGALMWGKRLSSRRGNVSILPGGYREDVFRAFGGRQEEDSVRKRGIAVRVRMERRVVD